MRFIVYGVGAIGGTVAACLARAGEDVAGIARGRQLSAIRESGLTLRTPDGDSHVRFDCAADPAELPLRSDDVILLCVKSQDTEGALQALRDAGAVAQPIFCLQNGVANERTALRYFENIYGVTVMMPADFETPGVVAAYGAPRSGIFDMSRYPHGRDRTVEAVADAFNASSIAAFVQDDVMPSKYGKLLLNLSNVLDAAFANRDAFRHWLRRARQEAVDAMRAAGVEWLDVGMDDPRRGRHMRIAEIDNQVRIGSSSRQSLVRRTGSIETDFLNGEIVLLGRLHSVPTPVNAALCRIGRDLAAGKLAIGEVTDADIERELAAT